MKEELKFEFLILLCICFTGLLCEKLVTTTSLSPLLLYGGILGVAFLLFVCALFTTMSVSSISDHPEARKNTRVLYGFLSLVAILTLLLLLVFEVESIIFWSIICILWYLTCTIRIALFWKWF
jgi:hypothetical protein